MGKPLGSNYWNYDGLLERYKYDEKAYRILEDVLKNSNFITLSEYHEQEDGNVDCKIYDSHGNILFCLEHEYSTKVYKSFWIKGVKLRDGHYLNTNPRTLLCRLFYDGKIAALVSVDMFYKYAEKCGEGWKNAYGETIYNYSAPTESKFIWFARTTDLKFIFEYYSKYKKFPLSKLVNYERLEEIL